MGFLAHFILDKMDILVNTITIVVRKYRETVVVKSFVKPIPGCKWQPSLGLTEESTIID